jgi:hypothetical protein
MEVKMISSKRLFLIISAFTASLLWVTNVYSLEYSFTDRNPIDGSKVKNYTFLLMKGKIKAGDYEELKNFLKTDPALTNFVKSRQIILASPGGDVREAMMLGDFVRKTFSAVSVGNHFGPCMSSCFLILSSSVSRSWEENTVGLHRPYLNADAVDKKSVNKAIEDQERAMTTVENYLQLLRVPQNVINVMMATSSDNIVWLDGPGVTFGRYSPSYEQFLVAKCGLDMELERRYFSGEKSAMSKVLKARECGSISTFNDAMNFFVVELGGKPPF